MSEKLIAISPLIALNNINTDIPTYLNFMNPYSFSSVLDNVKRTLKYMCTERVKCTFLIDISNSRGNTHSKIMKNIDSVMNRVYKYKIPTYIYIGKPKYDDILVSVINNFQKKYEKLGVCINIKNKNSKINLFKVLTKNIPVIIITKFFDKKIFYLLESKKQKVLWKGCSIEGNNEMKEYLIKNRNIEIIINFDNYTEFVFKKAVRYKAHGINVGLQIPIGNSIF